MRAKIILLSACLVVFSVATVPVFAAVAPGTMNAKVLNKTQYTIKMSSGWVATYGDAGSINSNPISVNSNVQVVTLKNFTRATKYTGAYDVWDKSGNYLGNCTLVFWGYPQDFGNAQSSQFCSGGVSVNVSKKKVGVFGDNGYFQFTISSSK